MKINVLHSTSALGEKLEFSATSAQPSFTFSLNLSQGAIEKPSPHATTEGAQGQDSAKASQKQFQEAIAQQRLTDCPEGLENSGFLGEETQSFFLNLAQYLQEAAQ